MKENQIPIVDQSCYCAGCEQFGSKEFYFLSAICLNCGKRIVAKNRKGDKPNYFGSCPSCEVAGRLNYGTTDEAEKWLNENTNQNS